MACRRKCGDGVTGQKRWGRRSSRGSEEKGRMGMNAPVQIHLPGRHRPSPPNGSTAGFTFKATPELANVTPRFGPSKGLGVVLTLHGKFGPSKPAVFSVQIGENACLNDGGEWVSPTEALCQLPPGNGHQAVRLSINHSVRAATRPGRARRAAKVSAAKKRKTAEPRSSASRRFVEDVHRRSRGKKES